MRNMAVQDAAHEGEVMAAEEPVLQPARVSWSGPVPAEGRERSVPLITLLGLVAGDALTYVEEHGPTTLRRLIRRLEWPASLVVMAVGALVRGGLVQGRQGVGGMAIEPPGMAAFPGAVWGLDDGGDSA